LIAETIWSGAIGAVRRKFMPARTVFRRSRRAGFGDHQDASRAHPFELGTSGSARRPSVRIIRLITVLLARLVGFWHRGFGRHRLPPIVGRVQGAQARTSGLNRGIVVESTVSARDRQPDRPLSSITRWVFPQGRRSGGSHDHLVGRWTQAAVPGRIRDQRQVRRGRLAADRGR
jgi:hypothetical protein